MSDTITLTDVHVGIDPEPQPTPQATPNVVPRRWFYQNWKFGPIDLGYYASPRFQLTLVSIICFLLPGAYNAMSGLGAAGQSNTFYFDLSQAGLYAAFSVSAFFSGSFVNRVGVRWSLVIGGLGYMLYPTSLLVENLTGNGVFVVLSGILLGPSAALLWGAQGCIMVSYPSEEEKGRFISWFWGLFNLGAVLGCLPALALNFNNHSRTQSPATNATYITFIALMCFGASLCFVSMDANYVIRTDGTRVELALQPTWKSEIVDLWTTLVKTDRYIVLLFPMFFVSNAFYTYQYNGYNQAHFTLRTRALNDLLYWCCQILGAFIFGYAIDALKISRATKAKAAWLALIALTLIVWGGGYDWQKINPGRVYKEYKPIPLIDWSSEGYFWSLLLYMAYGFYDAVWQSCIYWFLGALTNSGRTSANFTGFYKALQSAGAATMWGLDGSGIPYLKEFLMTWSTLAASLFIAAPVIFRVINNTNAIIPDEENPAGEIANTSQNLNGGLVPPYAESTATTAIPETLSHLSLQTLVSGSFLPRNELSLFRRGRDDGDDVEMSLAEALEATRTVEIYHDSARQF